MTYTNSSLVSYTKLSQTTPAADAQHRPHYAPLRGGAMLGGDAGQYLLADFQTGKL